MLPFTGRKCSCYVFVKIFLHAISQNKKKINETKNISLPRLLETKTTANENVKEKKNEINVKARSHTSIKNIHQSKSNSTSFYEI